MPQTQRSLPNSDLALKDFEESLALATAAKGRPKGSKNRPVDNVEAEVTRCGRCGSTKRGPFFNRREQKISGVHAVTAQPYTAVVTQRCKCLACGQLRDEKRYVNHTKPPRK